MLRAPNEVLGFQDAGPGPRDFPQQAHNEALQHFRVQVGSSRRRVLTFRTNGARLAWTHGSWRSASAPGGRAATVEADVPEPIRALSGRGVARAGWLGCRA